MTALPLADALRAGAEGIYTLEAVAELIIAHGAWLDREDFQHFIHHGRGSLAYGTETLLASFAFLLGGNDGREPPAGSASCP